MFERLKSYWKQIKRLRVGVRSVNLFRFIIIMGFCPYLFAISILIFITLTGQQGEWWFRLIDYALKISDHIFAPASVGAVLNLVPYWDDSDGNGIPDKLQEEVKK
ncbi:hypothetical protein [Acidaminococcus fermentans]|uniref:hypothetical protein n=1 Tax=Acidaminococcus fermentans TaxID=905 RepID=UPI003F8CE0B1